MQHEEVGMIAPWRRKKVVKVRQFMAIKYADEAAKEMLKSRSL